MTLQGNPFNYLPPWPRSLMGVAGFVAGLWGFSFNYVFSWLNARKDYKLFRVWMRMTREELPAKSERDYRVAGLSRIENKQFWETENYVNRLWCRMLNYYIALSGFTFTIQLFFVKLDEVDYFSAQYIGWQTFHVFQTFHAFYAFLHCYYTLGFWHVTSMRFFSKRFRYISRQLERLNGCSDRVNNRMLSRLIIENNQVHHEMIFINEFFKSYCGFNLLSFMAIGTSVVFNLLLDINLM